MEKQCPSCKEIKLFSEFEIDKRRPHGIASQCKLCRKAKYYSFANEKIRLREEQRRRAKGMKPRAEPSENTKRRKERKGQRLRNRQNSNLPKLSKKDRDRLYRQSPQGKLTQFRAKARRRARGGKHNLTPTEWNSLLTRFNNCCVYCGTSDNIVKDHFIPLVLGGQTTVNNIVPACRLCNQSKYSHHPIDWCLPLKYVELIVSLDN